jgi:hydroxymethylglutaryl-CoA reductase
MDSVIIATGNDFRATEAGGHAYASRNGSYQSLSYCEIEHDQFKFWLEIPIAIGTIGGLTALHPLAKQSLKILNNPSSEQLMRIVASVGLAQNFAAIRSLVTTGIQQGHMKMHIMNILNQLEATKDEVVKTTKFYEDKTISYAGIRDFIQSLRNKSST